MTTEPFVPLMDRVSPKQLRQLRRGMAVLRRRFLWRMRLARWKQAYLEIRP